MDRTLGENIKHCRKSRGFSQEKLASEAGLSKMSIRRYESGERQPGIEALDKIAEALDAIIYYDYEIRQHRLIAFEDGKTNRIVHTYADPDPERTRQVFKRNLEKEDNDFLSYDQSYSYASSEEELDKRLEQQEKQKEEAAKNAPKLVAYDENGNEIKDRPVKFTDKSMSFEEALAEAEAEELERIQTAYKRLNRKGKAKAVERVEELTEISRYAKEDPPRDPFLCFPKIRKDVDTPQD